MKQANKEYLNGLRPAFNRLANAVTMESVATHLKNFDLVELSRILKEEFCPSCHPMDPADISNTYQVLMRIYTQYNQRLEMELFEMQQRITF